MTDVVPLDFRTLVGRDPSRAVAIDERVWYYAALVWCHRNGAGVDVAQRGFAQEFGYPPKRWWDTTQNDPHARIPPRVTERMRCV